MTVQPRSKSRKLFVLVAASFNFLTSFRVQKWGYSVPSSRSIFASSSALSNLDVVRIHSIRRLIRARFGPVDYKAGPAGGAVTVALLGAIFGYWAMAEQPIDESETASIMNSVAFKALDQYVTDGILSQEIVKFHKDQYAKLHSMVMATYQREKELMKRAKTLNNDLLSEKREIGVEAALS